jgi:hypothetical protein
MPTLQIPRRELINQQFPLLWVCEKLVEAGAPISYEGVKFLLEDVDPNNIKFSHGITTWHDLNNDIIWFEWK